MKRVFPARPALLVLAAIAAIVAATGPRFERERVTRALMIVVDVTRSMNARDYTHDRAPESRLDALRRILPATIARLPCGSKVGLSIFTERRSLVLFEPTEVCAGYQVIAESIGALNWRMAWEGDSRVASGLFAALANAAGTETDVMFLSDGQEAPPLPWTGGPRFDGERGAVGGLIVGVGGDRPVPIPRFDDRGREVGTYAMADVPQESRTGAPPPDAESRPGFHPRNNPFGDMPPGTEHLTSVREDHLRELAAATGLGYARLVDDHALLAAIDRFARPRPVVAEVDAAPLFAVSALTLLLLALTVSAFTLRNNIRKRIPMFGKTLLTTAALSTLALLAPDAAHAHGPTPQKVAESVDIAAPCELVWSKLRDFGSIGSWHPGIAKVEAHGASERGATRVLTLPNGEAVEERLDEVNGAEQALSYRLSAENLKALPVSFYTARMTVSRPDPGPTCHVDWAGRFYRGDTTNDPPEDLNDAAAVAAMTAFFKDGLAGLKKAME